MEGQRGFPAACHLPAREGMVVETRHEGAARLRQAVLDLTLSMLTPVDRSATASARWAPPPGGMRWPAPPGRRIISFATDASKSFFVLDREACILCGRCTTACADVQHIGAISMVGRGHDARVGVIGDGLMSASICTSCGQCVATCPTGALRPKEAPAPIARQVETTCPYCGVGCGITLWVSARTGGWPAWPTTRPRTRRAAACSA